VSFGHMESMDCHTEGTENEGGSLTVYFKISSARLCNSTKSKTDVPFFASAPVQHWEVDNVSAHYKRPSQHRPAKHRLTPAHIQTSKSLHWKTLACIGSFSPHTGQSPTKKTMCVSS